MKINEILVEQQLEEGPIDFAKQVGAGIKGLGQGFAAAGQPKQPVKPGANDLETAINTVNAKPNTGILGKIGGAFQGAKAGWQTQGGANKQQDLTNQVTSDAIKQWGAQSQNIQNSTGKPPTADDATQWFKQFTGGQSPNTAPAGANPNPVQIKNWLNQEVGAYMAKTGQTANTIDTAKGPGALDSFKQGFKRGYAGGWFSDPNQQTGSTGTQQKPPQTPQTGQAPPLPQQGQDQPSPDQPVTPGTQQPQPGQAQPAEPIPLPVPLEKLTKEERGELRRQLQASLKMAA
jgi:hypothetical protein